MRTQKRTIIIQPTLTLHKAFKHPQQKSIVLLTDSDIVILDGCI